MPLTPAQRSAATQKAWIARRRNAALRAAGQMPPPVPRRQRPQQFCACGCGTSIVTGGVRRRGKLYIQHHAPAKRRNRPQRYCACGCGGPVSGRIKFLFGHRPVRAPRPRRPPQPRVVTQNPFGAVDNSFTAKALQALVGLEAALGAKLAEQGATDDMRRAFKRYKRIKEMAIAGIRSTDIGIKNEAFVALRRAALDVVAFVF